MWYSELKSFFCSPFVSCWTLFFFKSFFISSFVLQADAVILLEAGNLDVPSSWLKPGAVVIRCEPNLETGVALRFFYLIFVIQGIEN